MFAKKHFEKLPNYDKSMRCQPRMSQMISFSGVSAFAIRKIFQYGRKVLLENTKKNIEAKKCVYLIGITSKTGLLYHINYGLVP